MKKTTKMWVVSSILTFLTGFFGVVLLNIDALTMQSLETGALSGLMVTALRAGLKLLLEDFMSNRIK